jgi:hypothetical protein
MQKAALFFLALVMLVGYAAKDLGAAELCWRVDRYQIEYIKVSSIKPDSRYPHWLLNGIWYNPSSYLVPVIGTMEKSPDGTTRHVSLHGTFVSGDDLYDYILDATIDSVTKNGTIYVYSDLIGSTLPWNLTRIDCRMAPAP